MSRQASARTCLVRALEALEFPPRPALALTFAVLAVVHLGAEADTAKAAQQLVLKVTA